MIGYKLSTYLKLHATFYQVTARTLDMTVIITGAAKKCPGTDKDKHTLVSLIFIQS